MWNESQMLYWPNMHSYNVNENIFWPEFLLTWVKYLCWQNTMVSAWAGVGLSLPCETGRNFCARQRKRRKETGKMEERKLGGSRGYVSGMCPGPGLPAPIRHQWHCTKFIKESVSGCCLWNLVEALGFVSALTWSSTKQQVEEVIWGREKSCRSLVMSQAVEFSFWARLLRLPWNGGVPAGTHIAQTHLHLCKSWIGFNMSLTPRAEENSNLSSGWVRS